MKMRVGVSSTSMVSGGGGRGVGGERGLRWWGVRGGEMKVRGSGVGIGVGEGFGRVVGVVVVSVEPGTGM